jgi:hypothetical protein
MNKERIAAVAEAMNAITEGVGHVLHDQYGDRMTREQTLEAIAGLSMATAMLSSAVMSGDQKSARDAASEALEIAFGHADVVIPLYMEEMQRRMKPDA